MSSKKDGDIEIAFYVGEVTPDRDVGEWASRKQLQKWDTSLAAAESVRTQRPTGDASSSSGWGRRPQSQARRNVSTWNLVQKA